MNNDIIMEYDIRTKYNEDWILSYNVYTGVLKRYKASLCQWKDQEDMDFRNCTSGRLHRQHEQRDDTVYLTIVPTMKCNFRCEYCWESFRGKSITKQVIDSIEAFIEKEVDKAKRISISWFGGEALVAYDAVIEISKRIKRICDANYVIFDQRMATNGYLLTHERQKELIEYGLNRVVITLDGCADIHNQRRHLIDGGNTFETILSNIKNSLFEKIDLGVNVDDTNIEGIQDLLEQLEIVKNKIVVYFRWVFPKPNEWNTYYNANNFDEINNHIHTKLMEINWIAVNKGFQIRNPLFHRDIGYCKSDYNNHYIFGPNGELYKCNVEMDNKKEYGHLSEWGSVLYNSDYYSTWKNIQEKKETGCQNCIFLPTCNGGCSYVYKLTNKNKCVFISKNEAAEYIKMQYRYLEYVSERRLCKSE